MKNLNHNQKLIASAGIIVAIFALLVVGLKLQSNAFKFPSPNTIVLDEQSSQTNYQEVQSEQQNSKYVNPLNGVYVNPFSD